VDDSGFAKISVFNPPKGGGTSNEFPYRVRELTLISLSVTPANSSAAKGAKQQFTATGTYSDGSTKDLTREVTWTSAEKSVASIDEHGLASAREKGSTAIRATLGEVSAMTKLTVR